MATWDELGRLRAEHAALVREFSELEHRPPGNDPELATFRQRLAAHIEGLRAYGEYLRTARG
jgi:hypothetical protein